MPLTISQSAARTAAEDAIIIGVTETSAGPVPSPGSEDVNAALGGPPPAPLAALGAPGNQDEIIPSPPRSEHARAGRGGGAGGGGRGMGAAPRGGVGGGGRGGLPGVGQGSGPPPRLVRLTYTHPEAAKTVVFAGKGITFDSGGLSLKPPKAMEAMKSDMGGAAAVLGALQAIAALGPKVNVVGYLPMAENMPGGHAQRPSDVITIFGGKTVEVLNTDAEGRLVLADALARSAADTPDVLVDVATLTGAQVVALGPRIGGGAPHHSTPPS